MNVIRHARITYPQWLAMSKQQLASLFDRHRTEQSITHLRAEVAGFSIISLCLSPLSRATVPFKLALKPVWLHRIMRCDEDEDSIAHRILGILLLFTGAEAEVEQHPSRNNLYGFNPRQNILKPANFSIRPSDS